MQEENQAAMATAQWITHTHRTGMRWDGQLALMAKVRVGGDRQGEEIWDGQRAPLIRHAPASLQASGGLLSITY